MDDIDDVVNDLNFIQQIVASLKTVLEPEYRLKKIERSDGWLAVHIEPYSHAGEGGVCANFAFSNDELAAFDLAEHIPARCRAAMDMVDEILGTKGLVDEDTAFDRITRRQEAAAI